MGCGLENESQTQEYSLDPLKISIINNTKYYPQVRKEIKLTPQVCSFFREILQQGYKSNDYAAQTQKFTEIRGKIPAMKNFNERSNKNINTNNTKGIGSTQGTKFMDSARGELKDFKENDDIDIK